MSAPAAAASSTRTARVLPLFAGLPLRGVALEQQRANLVRFHEDNRAAFDAMPYEPWTQAPKSAGVGKLQFKAAAASPPLTGLRGVFSLQSVPAATQERQLLYYSGLLISSELYQRFCAQYYCPTGLELPALAYKDAAGRRVEMLIIGDPTSLAAIINDGVFGRGDGLYSRLRGTLHMRSLALSMKTWLTSAVPCALLYVFC